MKLTFLITRVAVTAAALAASSAFAQSSVTLFGVVDEAYNHTSTSGVGDVSSLVSGAYTSSRFGFRGAEDLGGGLSASFWLESFLSANSGASTPAGFQRRSTVSLAGKDWGELRMGRDYTPTHHNWASFDPFNYVGIGSNQLLILAATGKTPVTAAFGSNPNDVQRASDGIQYLLPRNSLGLDGGVLYSFNEGDNGTVANGEQSAVGGRLGFTYGQFYVSGALLNTKISNTANTFNDKALGASYNAGTFKVSAAVRRFDYVGSRQITSLLGVTVPFGVNELKASWVRASWGGNVGTTSISNNSADQFSLGYVYNFSKSTRMYATWAMLDNNGASRFVLASAPASTANGQSSRGFQIGINKDF